MKKNKISSVLSDEYLEQVKIMASKERRTLSQMIEIMLIEHIDNICNNKDKTKNEEKIDQVITEKIDYAAVVNMYNEICKSYPKVKSLSDSRKKAIKARLVKHTMEEIKEVFEKAEASDFMRGCNSKNWQASFDWMIMDRNMTKILDGNYDNRDAANTNKHPDRDSSYDGLNVFADDFNEW